MSIFTTDKPIDLRTHMLSTYQTLRVVLVVIALLLPWVLWIGGYYLSRDRLTLQRSMSAYYHANAASMHEFAERETAYREGRQRDAVRLDSGRGVMRNWFVGALFAISVLLAAYKGFRPAEDMALNLAAVFALLVAVFPSAWDDPGPFHVAFAISFFLCIAYVCIFCASATLSLVKEDRQPHYRRTYKLLGWTMVVSPVGAVILSRFVGLATSYVFFAEAFAVYAFAAYWLVKTIEIRESNADRRAVSGELVLPRKGIADAIHEIPVTSVASQNVGNAAPVANSAN